jgi:hypothetical protein
MKDSFLLFLVRWLKFALAGLIVYGFRQMTYAMGLTDPRNLLVINLCPLMATQFAGVRAFGPKREGLLAGLLYGSFGIVALDFVTGHTEMTWVTAPMYGLTALWGTVFLRGKAPTVWRYMSASIAGTIVFDLVTGVFTAPLAPQPYTDTMAHAALLQWPVTAMGILTNCAFACACPVLAKAFSNTLLEEQVVPEIAYATYEVK